jgi:hypothetical protein
MSTVGAPIGNTNSSKNNRLWAETIRRAVVQSDGKRLRKIAEALLDKAQEGDIAAIKELGDRLDGKSVQATDVSMNGSMRFEVVGLSWLQQAIQDRN